MKRKRITTNAAVYRHTSTPPISSLCPSLEVECLNQAESFISPGLMMALILKWAREA